jgi:Arc/MetJ-type ribon-helix-helix transcriptional regulator
MTEKVDVRLPPDLIDRMDARIEGSPQHENRSQFIRYCLRRTLAEPGEYDVTAGRPL